MTPILFPIPHSGGAVPAAATEAYECRIASAFFCRAAGRPRRALPLLGLPLLGLRLLALLLALQCALAGAAWADGPAPVASGVLFPAAPSYIDPVQLTVNVTDALTGALNGTITYTVDAGPSQTATASNGVALLPLGAFAPGAHSVTYRYSGTLGTSGSQTTAFNVTDVAFSYVGTEQTAIANHGGFAGLATDSRNNAYLTNAAENKLYKLDPQRNLTVISGVTGLSNPQGIAIDSSDNLYICDAGNNRVVELSPAGVLTTVAFTGLAGPTALTFDRTGAFLYVNDLGNGRIVQLTLSTGTQATVVTGIPRLTGLVVDLAGNLYFGQHYSYQDGAMYRLDPAGTLTVGYFGARSPDGLATDIFGNLYFTDDYAGLNKIDTGGHLTHLENFYGSPLGVDRAGQVYILATNSYAIAPGTTARFGNAEATGRGGPNSQPSGNYALYQVPYHQTLTSVDVVTGGNGLLDKFGPDCKAAGLCVNGIQFGPSYPGLHTGYFTAVLSSNAALQTNFFGIGLNSNAALDPGTRTSAPTSLTSAGGMAEAEDLTLYVTDPAAGKVFSLGVGGASIPTALAFTGLTNPTRIGVDGAKNVFVLDGSTRILELTPFGVQTTVYSAGVNRLASLGAMALDGSGSLFLGGPLGEGGPAITNFNPSTGREFILAQVPALPTLLAVDGFNNVYEADATTSTLRKYVFNGANALGTPTTLASGFSVPTGITVETSGTVFLALGSAGTLLQVRPDGSTANLYSGLGSASAVVQDGRGVLSLIDGTSGTLYLDDRRTGSYGFGTQQVNTTSPPQLGTITNAGNQTLGGIGGLPGDKIFSQVAEAGACVSLVPDAGTALAPGAFCRLDYTFTPPNPGPNTETGSEQDSTYSPYADYSGHTVNFAGVGQAGLPNATLTPATLSFGSVIDGTTSPGQLVTLTNTGTTALTISSIALSGSPAFAQANNCGSTLAAGASCTFNVTFSPAVSGSASGVLTVTDNASAGSTQQAQLSGTGTAVPLPSASLAPNPIVFQTVVGTPASSQIATLSNTGTGTLNIASVALTGSGTSFFSIVNNACGATLAAGASCNLTIGFNATVPATYSASLSVADNASPATQTVGLTGRLGGFAQAVLTPAALTYATTVNTVSATQTASLANTGTVAMPIVSIGITGSNANLFAETDNCPGSLAGGASCTINLTFSPTATGTFSAGLAVVDYQGFAVYPAPQANGIHPQDGPPPSTQTTTLTGTASAAAAPQAVLSPASAGFGNVILGQTATQTLTLTNAGTAALPITSASVPAGPFTLTGRTCASTLAAGASCTFTLNFTPTATGTQTAVFSVIDPVGTQSSTLTGTVTAAPAPQAALTPATASFGNVPLNTTAAAQVFTLTNAGTAALPIASTTLAGPGFTLSANTCATTLAAGASCTLSVTFTPTAAAPYTATLTVVDSVGTQSSSLTGTGSASTPPDFTITPSPASQSSYRGQSVSYTVALASLSGTNPFTGPVALTATGLPNGATATFSPAILVPGGSSSFTVAVPALSAANNTFARTGIAFAALLFGLGLTRRRRLAPRLLLMLLALVTASTLAGCGTGNGFAIPAHTSVITITGTSGATVHVTTVTLTVN